MCNKDYRPRESAIFKHIITHIKDPNELRQLADNWEHASSITDAQRTAPHKHAEIIKAWADGAIIQYYSSLGKWLDVVNNNPTWGPGDTYRVKPASKRTKGSRRYVFQNTPNDFYVGVVYENSSLSPHQYARSNSFVRWIDTEWQYHECEE